MKIINEFKLTLDSRSINESFARVAVAAFVSQYDPTTAEIQDIKTAVSEAVTNCIVHAYPDSIGKIYITVKMTDEGLVKIYIRDKGKGIPDIEKALEPLFTTGKEGERSGLGFTVMQSFCDKIKVRSKVCGGTTVALFKKLNLK